MINILKQKKVMVGAIAGIAILGFILPTQQVHADLFGVESFTSRAILGMLYYALDAIFGVIGYSVGVMAKLINVAVKVRAGGEIPVVKATWEILRDFSNMLFIIILIYMAFATIFNLSNYTFQKMIVRFIIVAVLINFSMSIGNLIIDATQVLSNVFLSSIGDLGNRLGEYMDPNKLLASTLNSGDVTVASLASLVFAVVLGGIFFFSLLVAAVFAIVRVPIIWGLLIVSPLAWMAYILPGTQKAYWNSWWNQFFGWNLFLPVYLFFMYLGLFFLSQRDQIIEAVVVTNANGVNPANSPLLGGLESSLTFNLIFFYLFTAFIMIGGTAAAVSATKMMGGGFEKGLGWARGTVGRVTGFDAQRAALKGAYDQRRSQFQQEGFKREGWINRWTGGGAKRMYGGKEADQRRESRYAGIMGVRGAQFKNAKDFVSAVDKEASGLRDQEKAGKIRVNEEFKTATARESNMSPRGLAMRSLLYERGMIDEKEFSKDMSAWVVENPFLAQSMAEKAKKGKYRDVKPTELLKMAAAESPYGGFSNPQATTLRKDWFDFLKENDKALGAMTVSQYATAISLRGGPKTNEAADYRKAIAKKRPDLVVDYDIQNKKLPKDQRIRAALLMKEIKDKKANEIAQMSDKVWADPDFVRAIEFSMDSLDKNDPPVEKDQLLPGGTKAKKAYAGGGANLKASLRKSVARNGKKLKIVRNIRPEEMGGEAIAEGEEKAEAAPKEEKPKEDKA